MQLNRNTLLMLCTTLQWALCDLRGKVRASMKNKAYSIQCFPMHNILTLIYPHELRSAAPL